MEKVKELNSLDSSIKRYKDEIARYSSEFKGIYDNSKSVRVNYSLIELNTAFKSAVAFNHHFAFSIGDRYFIRNSNSFTITIPIQEFKEITKEEYDKVLDLSWKCVSVETALQNSINKFNELKKTFEYNEFIGLADSQVSLQVCYNGVSVNIQLDRSTYIPLFIPFKDTDEESVAKVKELITYWRKLYSYITF